MSWQPVDCHAHTTMSDGRLSVEALVERAKVLDVRPSVSDHISHDIDVAIKNVSEIRAYLDTLDRYDVLRGGEFCWHDTLWREMPPELVPRFTHRIGSLHAIILADGRVVHAFSRRVATELSPDAYMDAHIDNIERFAREMPVDILGHPTLIPMSFRHHQPEELWSEDREERAVAALYHAGVAFEISSRYPPHERIVRRAVERGVRISLGSDGHTAQQVANVSAPLALARALGVTDTDLYDPIQHGSKTHAGDHARM